MSYTISLQEMVYDTKPAVAVSETSPVFDTEPAPMVPETSLGSCGKRYCISSRMTFTGALP